MSIRSESRHPLRGIRCSTREARPQVSNPLYTLRMRRDRRLRPSTTPSPATSSTPVRLPATRRSHRHLTRLPATRSSLGYLPSHEAPSRQAGHPPLRGRRRASPASAGWGATTSAGCRGRSDQPRIERTGPLLHDQARRHECRRFNRGPHVGRQRPPIGNSAAHPRSASGAFAASRSRRDHPTECTARATTADASTTTPAIQLMFQNALTMPTKEIPSAAC